MKNILKELYYFMAKNRQSGTTTLLKEIVSKKDCHIITHTQAFAKKEFKHTGISLTSLQGLGREKKPVLFDNAAIEKLINDTLVYIAEKEEVTKKLSEEKNKAEQDFYNVTRLYTAKNKLLMDVQNLTKPKLFGNRKRLEQIQKIVS